MKTNTPPVPTKPLWLIRGSLAVALAVSLFLLYQKLDGQISSLVGCGGNSGCAQVLGGRWSSVFGLPVTSLAACLYAAALVATTPPLLGRRLGRAFLAFAASTVALSAAWFVFLLVREQQFCPYCAVAHAAGLTFAATLLIGRDQLLPSLNLLPPAVCSAFAVLALATAQLLGPAPDTHLITAPDDTAPPPGVPVLVPPTRDDPDPAPPAAPAPEPALPSPNSISYAGGNIVIDTLATPSVGPADAPHPLTKFFDYTCSSCRDSHGDLHKLMAAYPGKFRVFLVPCPLNDACNPFTPNGVSTRHQGACELAKLALTVWHLAPESFPKYHNYLMALPLPPDLAAARTEAARYVTAENLVSLPTQATVDQQLDTTFADYAVLKQQGIVFPKLLLKDGAIIHGVARTPEAFLEAIAKRYDLTPPQ